MCSPEVSGHVMTLETEYGVPTVGVHGDAFARLVDSVVQVNGMPRARRAYVPTPVLTKTPAELRGVRRGRRSRLRSAVHGRGARGADPAARRRRSPRRRVRPRHSAPTRGERRGEPPPPLPRQRVDRLPTHRSADGGARRGDARGDEPRARRDRRPAAADRLPRVVGLHGGEGRGQRGHGGRGPVLPPRDPRARGERHDGAAEQHVVDGQHGRRERPDP